MRGLRGGGSETRRGRVLAGALALVAVAAFAVAGALALRGGDPEAAPAGPVDARAALAPCAELGPEDDRRACFLAALTDVVGASDDPRAAVAEVTALARETPSSFLLPNCHGLMHTVGRELAAERGVTLATLMDVLPPANDPSCSAGFAHGLIAGVVPGIDPARPREAVAVCAEAGTRYQRYSCVHGFGHAFMRVHAESLEPALALCEALGPPAPECAQGVFHDYWFSVSGFDGTEPATEDPVTDPRELCAAQADAFVLACWHRALLETRPDGFETRSGADVDALCSGLEGGQRAGCVTAASAIGPPQPARQLAICAELSGADALSCVDGVKVQNLVLEPADTYVDEIRYCDLLAAEAASRLGCYERYGRALAVITDGAFGETGCPELDPEAAAACAAGARAIDDPLLAFS